MENEIIELYKTTSIENIAKQLKIGKLKIKNILIKNNIPIKPKGGQIKYQKKNLPLYNPNKAISCNKCGKIYSNIDNRNGAIIEHIKQCYNIDIPSKLFRNNYKERNGIYWYLQFFTLIDKEEKTILKCPICDWSTTDINNNTGALTKHISSHNISIENFINDYPNYKKLFKIKKLTEYVTCKICGEHLKGITNTHVKKHGITIEEYKLKYPLDDIFTKTTKNKLSEVRKNNNINFIPTWISSGEQEIVEFLYDNQIITKNRSLLNGKEIDIVDDNLKICIEYNGLYYHTEKMGKDENYHLNKTKECQKLGYKLIHIFEDEWVKNKNIVKNKLLILFNKTDSFIKVGARKVTIQKINSKLKSNFLEENHIQGNDKCDIIYGAYYDNLLIGVMTFKSKRNMTKNNHNEYELSRFATKLGYLVQGLASKILNKFINDYKPNNIISFADIRWTPDIDNLYNKLGFKLVKINKPNYYYYNSKINKYKRFHKFNYGKNTILKKYPNADMNKTERELMEELGFSRIWDCGLYKYEMILKQ